MTPLAIAGIACLAVILVLAWVVGVRVFQPVQVIRELRRGGKRRSKHKARRFMNYKRLQRRLVASLSRQGYAFDKILVPHQGDVVILYYMGTSYILHRRRGWLHGRQFEIGDTLSGKFTRQSPDALFQMFCKAA